MADKKQDPLEGFHFDEFDPDLKQLTIRIHELVLKYPDQKEAFLRKVGEILDYDDNISSVVIETRE